MTYPRQSTDLVQSLSNYYFFTKPEQKIFNLYRNTEDPGIVKVILIKKKGAGGIRFPDFRLQYKATIIESLWYWHTHKKNPEI